MITYNRFAPPAPPARSVRRAALHSIPPAARHGRVLPRALPSLRGFVCCPIRAGSLSGPRARASVLRRRIPQAYSAGGQRENLRCSRQQTLVLNIPQGCQQLLNLTAVVRPSCRLPPRHAWETMPRARASCPSSPPVRSVVACCIVLYIIYYTLSYMII